jgi:hypothetical protein
MNVVHVPVVLAEMGMLVGTAVLVLIALAVIAKGALAIKSESITLKYGVQLTGPKAVTYGWIFCISGIAVIVIAIVVAFAGPLLP